MQSHLCAYRFRKLNAKLRLICCFHVVVEALFATFSAEARLFLPTKACCSVEVVVTLHNIQPQVSTPLVLLLCVMCGYIAVVSTGR